MTDQTPDSGIDPAHHADAVRARMADFCEWFGVEPVKSRVRKGDVYLTDDLVRWCRYEGVSIDWLSCGSVRDIVAAYRDKYRLESRFEDAIRKYDDTAQKYLLQCLKRHTDNGESLEDVMADFSEFAESRGGAKVPRGDADGYVKIPMYLTDAQQSAFVDRLKAEAAKDVTAK